MKKKGTKRKETLRKDDSKRAWKRKSPDEGRLRHWCWSLSKEGWVDSFDRPLPNILAGLCDHQNQLIQSQNSAFPDGVCVCINNWTCIKVLHTDLLIDFANSGHLKERQPLLEPRPSTSDHLTWACVWPQAFESWSWHGCWEKILQPTDSAAFFLFKELISAVGFSQSLHSSLGAFSHLHFLIWLIWVILVWADVNTVITLRCRSKQPHRDPWKEVFSGPLRSELWSGLEVDCAENVTRPRSNKLYNYQVYSASLS